MAEFDRLTAADETNFAVEARDTPMHQGALGVLEAAPLTDQEGRLRLAELRARVEARLERVPEMRRVLHATRALEGRPLWVDDPHFRIEDHVLAATLPPPGGLPAAIAFVEQQMAQLMDRTRPLWEFWFLEAYGPGEVGIFIKLHHALADGPAMVNIVAQIFDIEPAAVVAAPSPWTPSPPPGTPALIRDNARRKVEAVRRGVARLRHPGRLVRAGRVTVRGAVSALHEGRGAPRTSLNRPIAAGRRIGCVPLEMAEVKSVAHATGVKVNDVFLAVIAGGLREVLLSRGEPVTGVRIRASMAVSLHPYADSSTKGNEVGTMIVALPLDDLDPSARLAAVAAATLEAKANQRAVVTPNLMVLLARSGVTRLYVRRQHMINVLTTNLPGPPVPLYLAGSRLLDAIAIPPIAGNVTVSFAALSYDGRLNVSLIAEAGAWRDLDVLTNGMGAAWLQLKSVLPGVPAQAGRTALSA